MRWTVKVHISGTVWRIQLKFRTEGAPPRGNSSRKFHVFLFRECWATDAWKQCFLYSCKLHLCLSRALGFLGCTTHYRVSWYFEMSPKFNLRVKNFQQLERYITIKYKLTETILKFNLQSSEFSSYQKGI